MISGKITIGNVCFIIDKPAGKMLLLKRSREPMSNMSTGVGGKTHFNEGIYESCIREVKEETGLDARNLMLRGVIKTLLSGKDSSWILFVYFTDDFSGELCACPEGELKWVDLTNVMNENLIGFLREILPAIMQSDRVIEATIVHDEKGNVITSTVN